ncbi:MAG: alpha/beta hydrolase [Rhodospirillum sp.]|nr:alpha/beta hydrolase [Rhodospirillum sp.]MCF8489736.1 alpha/beta hydrolase [Rhodospirillum sp.]MCF8502780.1 alpha/beta hydrolase [Rhodospirillum sp.]
MTIWADELRHLTHVMDGERLNYLAVGEGPPVLLLHGWPQTSHAWRHVIPALSGEFRVIAPDLPGMGRSSKLRQSFVKCEIAILLHRFMSELGHQHYLVAGHDMGGQVAYPMAAKYRDAVRGLVFIESGLPGFGQEKAMDVGSGGSWHFGFNMAGDISEALVAGREELFLDFIFLRDKIGVLSEESISDADIALYARAMRRPGALRCMFGYYRALFKDAEDNRSLGKVPLDCPILAVSADLGYVGGAERTMRRVGHDVAAVVINGSGHYIPEEQPAALAAAIADFGKNRVFAPLSAARNG